RGAEALLGLRLLDEQGCDAGARRGGPRITLRRALDVLAEALDRPTVRQQTHVRLGTPAGDGEVAEPGVPGLVVRWVVEPALAGEPAVERVVRARPLDGVEGEVDLSGPVERHGEAPQGRRRVDLDLLRGEGL